MAERLGDVALRIKALTAKHCIRASGVIELNAAKRTRRCRTGVLGRGKHTRWLPSAIQRAAYGRGWRAVKTRIRGKRPLHRSVNATSTRAFADFTESSTTHVMDIRSVVALKFVQCQVEALDAMAVQRLGVFEVAWDETDHALQVGKEIATYPLMMMHCRLCVEGVDGVAGKRELCIPPAVLADTTAESMINAVTLRLPLSLQRLKEKATRSM